MKKIPCAREGCRGILGFKAVRRGLRHCTPVCRALDSALDATIERARRYAADPVLGPAYGREYLALVDIADRVSEWRGLVAERYANGGRA